MSFGMMTAKNSKNIDGDKYRTMLEAIKSEVDIFNLSAISMFMMGPRDKKRIDMAYFQIMEYCKERNIAVYPHGSYICAGIWNVTQKNRHENKPLMFIRHIKDHLVNGKQLGAKGVVIHVPRHPVANIVETMEILSNNKVINSVRRNDGVIPMLTLETPASRPDDELTYETPEKLNKLVVALTASEKITIGWDICIDTCHLWAGGVNFSPDNSWSEYEAALSDITKDKIKLIHLNGVISADNFGTGKDGHQVILSRSDAIWGHLITDEFREFMDNMTLEQINEKNMYEHLSEAEIEIIKNSSLFGIVQFAKKRNIAMICEISIKNYRDAKFAADVVNKLLVL